MATCRKCGRTLKNPVYAIKGIGPVCLRKLNALAASHAEELEQVSDLPFDPQTMDIVCERRRENGKYGEHDITHFNIVQTVVKHSPTGMEWGYHGSGPADFALNILNIFLPVAKTERCGNSKVNPLVVKLYQDFKAQFVAALPRQGGTIKGETIKKWIAMNSGR